MADGYDYDTIQYDEAGNATYGGFDAGDLAEIYNSGGGGDGWTPEEIEQYFGSGADMSGGYWTPEQIQQTFGNGVTSEGLASMFNDPLVQAEMQKANTSGSGGFLDWLKGAGTAAGNLSPLTGLMGSAVTGLGSYFQNQTSTDAAEKLAQAQLAASQLAAESAKFKPVGMTTNFGSSKFGYDAAGNVISAGYALSPQMKAQQDAMMQASGGMLNQFTGSQAATAPMGAAGQAAMTLGNQYLGTDPAAQAKKYYDEQMALINPTRERDYATLESRLAAQGRLGLATGGTSTLGASNPEMEALMNAQRMQDLQLAAQSTQGGMDYAKYGAGMVGMGGDLLKQMYGTQVGSYTPYQTALGGATNIEGLGQSAMDQATALGAKTSTAAGNVGSLLGQGMINSAQTMVQPNSQSMWGGLLSGMGQQLNNYQQAQNTATALSGTGYNY